MSLLDLIAHPVSLWALGLLGSLSRTLMHRSEETGKRVMPWKWIADHPGRTATAVIGSLMLLAVLERAGQLDGDGLLPALLALGAGALGSEALPLVMDKAKGAVRQALDKAKP